MFIESSRSLEDHLIINYYERTGYLILPTDGWAGLNQKIEPLAPDTPECRFRPYNLGEDQLSKSALRSVGGE